MNPGDSSPSAGELEPAGHDQTLAAPAGVSVRDGRVQDPGLPPHKPRLGDKDPKARNRAVRQVAALFGISALGAIAFVVFYFIVTPQGTVGSIRLSTLVLGLCLFACLFGLGAGAVHWAKAVMDDKDVVEERHPLASSVDDREGAVEELAEGAKDSGIARRPLLKASLLGAAALVPLTAAVPLIGNVGGDWGVQKFMHTVWRRGRRLARDPEGTPIKASEVTIGSVFHVIPEGLDKESHPMEEKAKAIVLLIRLDPRELHLDSKHMAWTYDGIIAYSKVCTHVGCPVALYEQQTKHLLCPCHQSTFDVANGAKVIFGPAKRPLPQLPIGVDSEGYLIAQGDFDEAVGPSFWERKKWS